MKSKTSLFNWTLFKKDIFRVWPFWVLQIVVLQLMCTVQIFSGFLYFKRKQTMGSMTTYIPSMQSRMLNFIGGPYYVLIIAVICIISAILVFSYLNKRVESYMIHSLPITRQALFVTHGLSGFVMALGPIMITFIIMFLENALIGTGMGEVLIQYMFQSIVMTFFFYAMACLVVMVSGHGFMSIVIYTVANFLVYGLEKLFYMVRLFYTVDNVSSYALLNFSASDISMPWTPILEFMKYSYRTKDTWSWTNNLVHELLYGSTYWNVSVETRNLTADWKVFGQSCIYIVPAMIFIGIALWLYKKRPLEYIGNHLAFKWCKYVFLWIFSMFCSLIFLTFLGIIGKQSFFARLTYQHIMIVAVVLVWICSLIFYIVGDMILSKDFHIWSHFSWKWSLIFSAMIACAFAGMNFFYESSSVPDAKQVSYAMVSVGGNNKYTSDDSTFIECLGQIQKKFLKEVDSSYPEVGQEENPHTFLETEYVLKNGKHVQRSYWVLVKDYENIFKELTQVLNTYIRSFDQMIYPVENAKSVYCSTIYIDYYSNGKNMTSYVTSDEEIRDALYEALVKDLKENHVYIETVALNNSYDPVYVPMSGSVEDIFLVFESKDTSSDFTATCNVYVTEESKYTIEVMKKYQIYDYKDILNAYK